MLTPPSTPARLEKLYGVEAAAAAAAIEAAINDVAGRLANGPADDAPRWTERDVVLITYADILRPGEGGNGSPLATLRDWLVGEGHAGRLSAVHLLPFCPYSSDDGFSVIDYLAVDPASGTWEDIRALGEPFELMFDLVLNHCSQHSEWFQAFLRDEPPHDRFFIDADPKLDLSQVTRPRSSPLLTPYETPSGTKHVWTTFSADQVDLNYHSPTVLAEMLRILLEYAERGGRIIRLDAIAYLWKTIGTNCIHLPETHEVVKLCRDLLAMHAPRTLVLTETNVPHAENVSYFGETDPATGEGDEAHLVYNFSLPPLLLEAFVSGDATAIRAWLVNLDPPPPGCTFFNFTASHDGVGVRPLEGLVSPERFDRLVAAMRDRGGLINMKRNPDGSESPYEMCITYVDALSPPARQGEGDLVELHARRFLSSQAVALALRGMPAVYFHSLVGTQNDYAGVEASNHNRRINRHKYTLPELESHLGEAGSLAGRIYAGYKRLLEVRRTQPAFHPDAPQEVVDTGSDRVLAFRRESLDGKQSIIVAVNFGGEDATFPVPAGGCDLISGTSPSGDSLTLGPFSACWLRVPPS